jgi:hypothetical protein
MTTIKIEKDIPLPTRGVRTTVNKYPIDQLEVGDSFFATVGKATLSGHARAVAKITGRKFVVRSVVIDGTDSGARIWRKS